MKRKSVLYQFKRRIALLAGLGLSSFAHNSYSQVVLTSTSAYTQNFDGLSQSSEPG
jgi:hypothetical protein